MLLGAFLVLVMLSFNRRFAGSRPLVWTVVGWVAARTLFFAVTNNVETRYTAPTTPAIELVVALGVLSLLGRRRYFGIGEIWPRATVPSAS